MIMALSFTIVPTGAIPEVDLMNQAGRLEITQGVIDGGIADRGQTQPSRLENLAGSWVIFPFQDYLKDRLALWRKLLTARLVLIDSLGCFHDRLRLILNRADVKQVQNVR